MDSKSGTRLDKDLDALRRTFDGRFMSLFSGIYNTKSPNQGFKTLYLYLGVTSQKKNKQILPLTPLLLSSCHFTVKSRENVKKVNEYQNLLHFHILLWVNFDAYLFIPPH